MSRIVDLDNLLLDPVDFSNEAPIDEAKKQLFDSVADKLLEVMKELDAMGIHVTQTSQVIGKLLSKLTAEEATMLIFKGTGDHIVSLLDELMRQSRIRSSLLN